MALHCSLPVIAFAAGAHPMVAATATNATVASFFTSTAPATLDGHIQQHMPPTMANPVARLPGGKHSHTGKPNGDGATASEVLTSGNNSPGHNVSVTVKKTMQCLATVGASFEQRWAQFETQIRSQDPTFVRLAGTETSQGRMHSKLPPREYWGVEYEADDSNSRPSCL
jgi:hypothetical protein